jgi:uncharacterized protein
MTGSSHRHATRLALDPRDVLTYPAAQLLAEPIGTSRTYQVAGLMLDLGPDLQQADPLEGTIRLARTNRGLLVSGRLLTSLAVQCSRCLRDIEVPVEVELQEEALPSVELGTGLLLDTSAEPDVLRLNDHHELELEPVVREAIQLAEPIAPLCEPDCPGLCAVCGQRLDLGPHDHGEDEVDPRLEALRSFAVDAERETE